MSISENDNDESSNNLMDALNPENATLDEKKEMDSTTSEGTDESSLPHEKLLLTLSIMILAIGQGGTAYGINNSLVTFFANQYVTFIAAIVVLISGADVFTQGAAAIARILNAPEFLIGSTIVAIGTSLPELGASLLSVQLGHPDIVLGNVIGSNIANICLVIGLSGLIKGITIEWNLLLADIPFLLVSAISFLFVSIDGTITQLEGVLLILMYFTYVGNLIGLKNSQKVEQQSKKGLGSAMTLVLMGAALVFFGAKYTVTSATGIGHTVGSAFGLSKAVIDTVIGFSLIAVGTSLPELVTSIVAEKTGHGEMIIGDVIGSNNFNILMVVGIVAVLMPWIHPPTEDGSVVNGIQVPEVMRNFFIPIMLVLSLLFVVMLIDRKITRFEAALLFILYLVVLVNMYGSATTIDTTAEACKCAIDVTKSCTCTLT